MRGQRTGYAGATTRPAGTVICCTRKHATLNRNFQVMPGAEWLELLCRHIPDRYEHLVNYLKLLVSTRVFVRHSAGFELPAEAWLRAA